MSLEAVDQTGPKAREPNGAESGWQQQHFQQPAPHTHHATSHHQAPANVEGGGTTQPYYIMQAPTSYNQQMHQQSPQLMQYALQQQSWQGNGGNAPTAFVSGLHQGNNSGAGTVMMAPGTGHYTSPRAGTYGASQGGTIPMTVPNSGSWTTAPSGPVQGQMTPQQQQPGQPGPPIQPGQPVQMQVPGQQMHVQGQHMQLQVQHQQQIHMQRAHAGQDQQQQHHHHGSRPVMYYTSGPQPMGQQMPLGQQLPWQQQQQQFPQHQQHSYQNRVHFRQGDGMVGGMRDAGRRDKKRGRAEEPEAAMDTNMGRAMGALKGSSAQRPAVPGEPRTVCAREHSSLSKNRTATRRQHAQEPSPELSPGPRPDPAPGSPCLSTPPVSPALSVKSPSSPVASSDFESVLPDIMPKTPPDPALSIDKAVYHELDTGQVPHEQDRAEHVHEDHAAVRTGKAGQERAKRRKRRCHSSSRDNSSSASSDLNGFLSRAKAPSSRPAMGILRSTNVGTEAMDTPCQPRVLNMPPPSGAPSPAAAMPPGYSPQFVVVLPLPAQQPPTLAPYMSPGTHILGMNNDVIHSPLPMTQVTPVTQTQGPTSSVSNQERGKPIASEQLTHEPKASNPARVMKERANCPESSRYKGSSAVVPPGERESVSVVTEQARARSSASDANRIAEIVVAAESAAQPQVSQEAHSESASKVVIAPKVTEAKASNIQSTGKHSATSVLQTSDRRSKSISSAVEAAKLAQTRAAELAREAARAQREAEEALKMVAEMEVADKMNEDTDADAASLSESTRVATADSLLPPDKASLASPEAVRTAPDLTLPSHQQGAHESSRDETTPRHESQHSQQVTPLSTPNKSSLVDHSRSKGEGAERVLEVLRTPTKEDIQGNEFRQPQLLELDVPIDDVESDAEHHTKSTEIRRMREPAYFESPKAQYDVSSSESPSPSPSPGSTHDVGKSKSSGLKPAQRPPHCVELPLPSSYGVPFLTNSQIELAAGKRFEVVNAGEEVLHLAGNFPSARYKVSSCDEGDQTSKEELDAKRLTKAKPGDSQSSAPNYDPAKNSSTSTQEDYILPIAAESPRARYDVSSSSEASPQNRSEVDAVREQSEIVSSTVNDFSRSGYDVSSPSTASSGSRDPRKSCPRVEEWNELAPPATDSPRARYDVSSASDSDHSGPKKRSAQHLEPDSCIEGRERSLSSGRVSFACPDDSPRRRYDVSSSDSSRRSSKRRGSIRITESIQDENQDAKIGCFVSQDDASSSEMASSIPEESPVKATTKMKCAKHDDAGSWMERVPVRDLISGRATIREARGRLAVKAEKAREVSPPARYDVSSSPSSGESDQEDSLEDGEVFEVGMPFSRGRPRQRQRCFSSPDGSDVIGVGSPESPSDPELRWDTESIHHAEAEAESDSMSEEEHETPTPPQKKKLVVQAPGLLIPPTTKDFEWGHVDIDNPLGPHWSLLDRLAGRKSLLPAMPLPQVMDQEIEGDGVPYAASIEEPSSSSHDSPPAVKSKSKRSKNKKAKTTAVIPEVTPQRKPIGTNHPTKPVTDADRRAGEGHWGTLLQAGAIPPLEGQEQENVKAEEQKKRSAEGAGGAKSAGPVLAPIGIGDVDPETYARMFPGGAIINVKGFDVKDKSAVSAAFELCVSMDPKTRPKFEFRGGVKSKTAPFTLHVEVHGVKYTEATAKSMKLAKQLAAINFLREAIGSRMDLDLSRLLQDGAGGAAATAAIKAAVAKGSGSGASGAGGAGDKDGMDEVTRAALGDGKPNYAQLLHDLVAAHHETPTFASYAFKSHKELGKDQGDNSSDAKSGKGFQCTAKLLRHVVNVEETSKLQEMEKLAKEKADKAQEKANEEPDNEELSSAAEVAAAEYEASKSGPKLDISVMESTGDGPSKREAKHKAAENMIYVLLPQCKTDDEMRAEAQCIIDVYHVEKKARMEEEQRQAQVAKAKREAAEAQAKAAKAAKKAAKLLIREAAVKAAALKVGNSKGKKASTAMDMTGKDAETSNSREAVSPSTEPAATHVDEVKQENGKENEPGEEQASEEQVPAEELASTPIDATKADNSSPEAKGDAEVAADEEVSGIQEKASQVGNPGDQEKVDSESKAHEEGTTQPGDGEAVDKLSVIDGEGDAKMKQVDGANDTIEKKANAEVHENAPTEEVSIEQAPEAKET